MSAIYYLSNFWKIKIIWPFAVIARMPELLLFLILSYTSNVDTILKGSEYRIKRLVYRDNVWSLWTFNLLHLEIQILIFSLIFQVFGTRLDTDIPKEASVAGEQESLIGSLGLCHACCCRSWGRRWWRVSKLRNINCLNVLMC